MAKHSPRQKSLKQGPAQSNLPPGSIGSFKTENLFKIVMLVLAGAGILVTSYLTYSSWFDVHPAFCGEGSGCDLVQSSRWSTFLGLPMALWGLLTYVGIVALAWHSRRKPARWTALLMVAVIGFVISAYLTIISVVEIETTCGYCLTSFALITAIMILAIVRQPPGWAASLKEAVVIGLLIVGGLHMHYSGWFSPAAGPEDPQLQALAIHLNEIGANFYGAHWCPSCQEQKAMFEASAKRLPYVECSSGGRGSAMTPLCVKENIRNYPTWIIGEMRFTGIKTPRELALASEFNWQE
jgi:uncharacterized membrane protein